jgi:hypothetical protein
MMTTHHAAASIINNPFAARTRAPRRRANGAAMGGHAEHVPGCRPAAPTAAAVAAEAVAAALAHAGESELQEVGRNPTVSVIFVLI